MCIRDRLRPARPRLWPGCRRSRVQLQAAIPLHRRRPDIRLRLADRRRLRPTGGADAIKQLRPRLGRPLPAVRCALHAGGAVDRSTAGSTLRIGRFPSRLRTECLPVPVNGRCPSQDRTLEKGVQRRQAMHRARPPDPEHPCKPGFQCPNACIAPGPQNGAGPGQPSNNNHLGPRRGGG